MCRIAKASRSGFYAWFKREKRAMTPDERLVVELFKKSAGILGYRQLKMRFERRTGQIINVKKVRRIKRDFGLVTKIRRVSKFRAVFKRGEQDAVAPNILMRRFVPVDGQHIWTTDVTELRFAFGQRAYLSAVKELGSNRIVAHTVGRSPTIELATKALLELIDRSSETKRRSMLVHSDQGFQYTNVLFRGRLQALGVQQSMSRRGNCLDNAPIESFFGHLKDEAEIKGCRTLKELEKSIDRYMKYYNEDRPQWGLKRRTPAEAGVQMSLVF
jgi:putative transposase